MNTDKQAIRRLVDRATDKVYPSVRALEKELLSGRRLTVYYGIDPTSTKIHIGHTVPLRKLREFQNLGHRVILLIGDFTARIGDPTGKDKARAQLSEEQVRTNFATYRKQAAKVLDFSNQDNPIEIRFNSEWLSRLTFEDVVRLASNFTVQQMLERDMFERRLKDGQPIALHEFFYPLMQGYDSVAMEVDVEVGGSDQTFNMLTGRDLVKLIKNKEKLVLTTPLLTDAHGKKMSKSEGNVVPVDSGASDMYGKVMAMGDEAIIPTFLMATDETQEEISHMQQALKKGENPRDVKALLAHTLVSMYYSVEEADQAAQQFKKVFTDKQAPDEMPVYTVKGTSSVADIMMENKLAASRSEASRLVKQGGVKLNEKKVGDPREKVELKKTGGKQAILQVGKRKFVRLVTGG